MLWYPPNYRSCESKQRVSINGLTGQDKGLGNGMIGAEEPQGHGITCPPLLHERICHREMRQAYSSVQNHSVLSITAALGTQGMKSAYVDPHPI